MDLKELEVHSLVTNKHRNQNCGQKKIVFGGSKEKEARRVFGKAMNTSLKVVFALTNQ